MTGHRSKLVRDIESGDKLPLTQSGVRVRESIAAMQIPKAKAGEAFRVLRVPSRARVSGVFITTDGRAEAGAVDVGIYRPNGGQEVAPALFHSGLALKDRHNRAPVTGGVEVLDLTKQLWEVLRLPFDPGVEYDLALTVAKRVTGDTSVAVLLQYAVND